MSKPIADPVIKNLLNKREQRARFGSSVEGTLPRVHDVGGHAPRSAFLKERATKTAPAFKPKLRHSRRIQCIGTNPEHLVNTFAIRIKPAVQTELAAASVAEARGEFYTAFQHLERAHVLGQATTVEHVRVHWRMFQFALRNRRYGEATGQLWRMVAASIFTALGLVPEGNTGGSDVSGFRRLPLPKDLKQALDAARA